MSDTFTLTLSIVLAAVSTVTALVALRQFPRPYMVYRAWQDPQNRPEAPVLWFQISNIGKSEAYDVSLRIHREGHEDAWVVAGLNYLPLTDHVCTQISLVDATIESEWRTDQYGQHHPPEGEPRHTLLLDFELTWHQAPTMTRTRTKSFVVRSHGQAFESWEQAHWLRWWRRELEWIRYYPSRRRFRT